MRDRALKQEPIVPSATGNPPNWVVRCLCGFAHDSHGATAAMALATIRQHHPVEAGHELTAEPVDYTTGYAERPGGDGPKTHPHPLYRS